MPEVKDCPDGDCPVPSTSTTPAVAAPPASNLLKPNTFSPPVLDVGAQQEELPRVVIEFCDRCKSIAVPGREQVLHCQRRSLPAC